jgi:hypothetical protein
LPRQYRTPYARAVRTATTLLLVAACGGGASTPSPDADPAQPRPDAPVASVDASQPVADAAPVDATPPPPTRFAAEPLAWTTPTLGTSAGYRATSGRSTSTGFWELLDLDADGRLDLVDTSAAGGPVQHGQPAMPHWRLYRNSGGAFATEAQVWTTPAVGSAEGYYAPVGVPGTGVPPVWGTLDLDGDALPDLVSASPDGVGPHGAVGAYVWHLYVNDGTGFATSPLEWPVPQLPVPQASTLLALRAPGEARWAVRDFDGDGLPDLLWLTPAGPTPIPHGFGDAPHWRVYLNTGAGFTAEPLTWALPSAHATNGYNDLASCDSNGCWATLDLDGDARPDLVSTGLPTIGSYAQHGLPATPHWLVYRNTGAGFASEPEVWPTPAADQAIGYFTTAFGLDATGVWSTLDLDGDALPDLVSTAPATADSVAQHGLGEAAPRWHVYRNTGAGFATEPLAWSTPDAGTAYGFLDAQAGDFAFTGAWQVADLDGDTNADLVFTAPAGGELVQHGHPAAPHWQVFLGTP